MPTETFNIPHRYSGGNVWTGEVDFPEGASAARKLGLAVLEARKQGAYLRGADLRGAYLRGAYLQGADLQGAYLRGADLRGAYLRGAYLQGADLQGAYLQGADLRGADLRGAYLRGAYLRGADLRGADLQGAYLQGAYLQGADLQGADLRGAKDFKPTGFQIPQEGELIVYKKLQGGVVVKLRVPSEARRTATPIGRKCRAEWVEVIEGEGTSQHDGRTKYAPGLTVRPDSYDDSILVECTNGIHFFLTKEEAEAY